MLPKLATTLNSKEPGAALINAIDKLLSEDRYLFTCDANERSLTHHLACYLQSEFADWHVDCEYNRDINSSDEIHFRKRLVSLALKPDSDDTEGKTVFPDIIVHKRGTTNNYLVIEVKKRIAPFLDGLTSTNFKPIKPIWAIHTLYFLYLILAMPRHWNTPNGLAPNPPLKSDPTCTIRFPLSCSVFLVSVQLSVAGWAA